MSASLKQINVKPQTPGAHGLPKSPVGLTNITSVGLDGDYNNWRMSKKNNDPDLAVMLISTDVLEQLNSEGWPVTAGDLGENLTLTGIDYDTIKLGKKYSIGEVEIEISLICEPCSNLYALPYVGQEKGPEFMKTLVNRRGWYARVLNPGTVCNGDPVKEIID